MKKITLIFSLFFFQAALAQPVVFCPPGAEWHYLFQQGITGVLSNESIKYIGDSLLGQDSVKVLKQKLNKYYVMSNYAPGANNLTFIKQKGDTVFFKNYLTQGSWQILYNFAALPGQSWQTTIKTQGTSSAPGSSTYTVTVNSVTTSIINSFTLRILNISLNPNLYNASTQIIERLGGNAFFYHFMNQSTGSDPDFIKLFLCYQDSTFGLKKFSETLDCYKDDRVGLEEYANSQSLKLFPNPAGQSAYIEINDANGVRWLPDLELSFTDLSGREVKKMPLKAGVERHTIDLSGLKSGVYLTTVWKEGRAVYYGKLIRE